jgi:hypothetical protein
MAGATLMRATADEVSTVYVAAGTPLIFFGFWNFSIPNQF